MFLSITYIFFEKSHRKKTEARYEDGIIADSRVGIVIEDSDQEEDIPDEEISEDIPVPENEVLYKSVSMDIVRKETIYTDITRTKVKRAWN